MAEKNGSDEDRSLDQVEAELAAARKRLASTVDDLAVAVSPKEVAKRQAEKVKGFFVDADGSVRTSRVGAAVGGLVGLVGLRALVRRRG